MVGEDTKPYQQIKKELMDKQFFMKQYDMELEQHLAKVQIERTMRKMNITNLIQDERGIPDPEFGVETGFEPLEQINRRDLENSVSLPDELRKVLYDREPELQNVYRPIFDEASR